MNQNPLIEVLEANHLLRSPDEVTIFEQTLAELAQNPNPVDLPSLHLILDEACEQPEVMFSLVQCDCRPPQPLTASELLCRASSRILEWINNS